ncbi:HIT family protein [Candidatus Gracilibacteria bacterium]|nr:HIT family protein [Candidatus Gracilibacteria bacterium]
MPTLFSRIIAGEIPSYKIYEDEYIYAFLDIAPQRLGHTLIVAKIEIDHFSEVPEPYYSAIFQTAKILSPAIQQTTGCNRVCTMFVGYEVPHCHYHLIPTDSTSDLDHSKVKKVEHAELKKMQEKILAHL